MFVSETPDEKMKVSSVIYEEHRPITKPQQLEINVKEDTSHTKLDADQSNVNKSNVNKSNVNKLDMDKLKEDNSNSDTSSYRSRVIEKSETKIDSEIPSSKRDYSITSRETTTTYSRSENKSDNISVPPSKYSSRVTKTEVKTDDLSAPTKREEYSVTTSKYSSRIEDKPKDKTDDLSVPSKRDYASRSRYSTTTTTTSSSTTASEDPMDRWRKYRTTDSSSTSSSVRSARPSSTSSEGSTLDLSGYTDHEVQLNKGAVGLGFCIEGGKASPLGDRPITVKRLFKGVY